MKYSLMKKEAKMEEFRGALSHGSRRTWRRQGGSGAATPLQFVCRKSKQGFEVVMRKKKDQER